MTRILAALVAAVLVAGTAVFAATRNSPDEATPTRVVNVFLDGINGGDFRQACSVQDLEGASMQDCETYYAMIVAQAEFSGGLDHYRVVPHSVKVWEQPYRDRTVRLAVVDFRYGSQAEQVLTAHLRWTEKRGWVLWFIG